MQHSKTKVFMSMWEAMDWVDEEARRVPNFIKSSISYNYDFQYEATVVYYEDVSSGDLFESAGVQDIHG